MLTSRLLFKVISKNLFIDCYILGNRQHTLLCNAMLLYIDISCTLADIYILVRVSLQNSINCAALYPFGEVAVQSHRTKGTLLPILVLQNFFPEREMKFNIFCKKCKPCHSSQLLTEFFSWQPQLTATNRLFWLVAMTNGYQLDILVVENLFWAIIFH